jgi:predicted RNase H-like nuclease (RuvC/YqgF family)
MENITQVSKNVTLSFKTTAEEKTALQQIANDKQISRSELIASLVHAYKNNYDYIGKTSPKEEELKSRLKRVEKENRNLNLSLENAEHRIEMEQNTNKKFVKEQQEMNKTIFNLQDELKTTKFEISRLNEIINQPLKSNQYDSNLLYGSLGSLILSGISLILLPSLFRE